MTKKKPRYEPRGFDGRIIQSDEIERIHKGILAHKQSVAMIGAVKTPATT